MSGLKTELVKQSEEPSCSCKDLAALMTKIVEQNTILIQQASEREALIMQLIEQNDEILSELIDQEDDETGSQFLDMD
ncbi:hypothetical protein [Psychrobacter sp. 2Y5]|uniref:hypothetical protein n=2 Tax=Psychrobacter TaxID=497 RepID=UPI003F482243